MKKVILLLSAVAAFTTSSRAQFVCGTDEVNNKFKEQYPEISKNEAQLKADILAQLSGMNLSQFAKTTDGYTYEDVVTLDVPIVFHIVHDYGSEYVSDNIVYEALNDINRCFNKQNPDTNVISTYAGYIPGTPIRYIANAHIKFHLAQRDPNGNPTKGITRRRSWSTSTASNQSKGDQWPPQSYMNIWLIRSFDANSQGVGAFALRPGTVHNSPLTLYDGIIGLSQQTVSDHTLAHELAHTLNIPHTWGGTNTPNVQCGDDGMDDTPPTKGHSGGGCNKPFPGYDTTCATGYEKTYSGVLAKNLFNVGDGTTARVINFPDTTNSENIMDYTGCAKMFTYLQGVTMRACLRSNVANRDNLVTQTNLINTGVMDAATNTIKPLADLPPIADFSTNNALNQNSYICAGDNVTFTNRSWNDTISGVNWIITDAGNVTKTDNLGITSTIQNFTNPGWLSVKIIAYSNAGSDTFVKNDAVYIHKNVGTNARGYVQSFDNDPDINEYPMFNYYGNRNSWSIVNGVGYYDNSSMRMRAYDDRYKMGVVENFYNSPIGDLDEFFTPPFDLTSFPSTGFCNLNFMLSAASTTGNISAMGDVLEISYRNCGGAGIWTTLASLTKGDLITAGIDTTEYAPKSLSDWKAVSLNIPAAARTTNTVFRFRYRCGGKVDNVLTGYRATGNNVFIDRISFNDSPTDVDGIAYEKNGFALAPNPTTGSTQVVIKGSNNATKTTIQVTDMTGKVVYNTQVNVSGNARVEIPANYLSVKGIYMVSVITDSKKHTDKLVVY